jgi:hypothetical protein
MAVKCIFLRIHVALCDIALSPTLLTSCPFGRCNQEAKMLR